MDEPQTTLNGPSYLYKERVEVGTQCHLPERERDWCVVEAYRADGSISVMTDPHEGHVFMALPLAEKVYEALGRALEAARKRRAEMGRG